MVKIAYLNMGKGCIDLLQGEEHEGGNPQGEGIAVPVAQSKSKAKCGKGKKDVKLRKDSSVECSGCGRWVSASDADVVGILESEVDKMEVFCLRCVYGVLSELRAELRMSRDEVCALREAQLTSSSQLREVVKEGCQCKCNCKVVNVPLENQQDQLPSETSQIVTPAAAIDEQVSVNQTSAGMKRPHTPPSPTNQMEDDGFMVVHRKKRRIKPTINIVGDSMVRNVTKMIKCGEEGSGCASLRGAGIK